MDFKFLNFWEHFSNGREFLYINNKIHPKSVKNVHLKCLLGKSFRELYAATNPGPKLIAEQVQTNSVQSLTITSSDSQSQSLITSGKIIFFGKRNIRNKFNELKLYCICKKLVVLYQSQNLRLAVTVEIF